MTTLVTSTTQDNGPQPDPGAAPSLRPGLLPGMIPPSAPPHTRRRGWWRRNAVWLVLLPVAVAVAAGASSFRVWAYWWPVGPHQEVDRATMGEPAHLADEYIDFWSDVPGSEDTPLLREIDATVTSVEQVDQLPPPSYGDPVAIPDGSVAYAVQLHLAAEPQTDVSGCRVTLLSDDGTRYGEIPSDILDTTYRCLPPEAQSSVTEQPEWDAASFVLADAAATITQVRVTFDGPEYVTIDLP